ncbi:unnamed protein product [Meloidogyne enterolobii]|uniref:Uncharacterized protein n=1 Tax=Meloidogyne enterolobii TaxID=390850 RepID=A0ACB0YYV5_MELEN
MKLSLSSRGNLRLMMWWSSVLHKNELAKTRPSLNNREKPFLKELKIRSCSHIIEEEHRPNNSFTTYCRPNTHLMTIIKKKKQTANSWGVERFLAKPMRVHIIPIAKILMVYVPVEMEM